MVVLIIFLTDSHQRDNADYWRTGGRRKMGAGGSVRWAIYSSKNVFLKEGLSSRPHLFSPVLKMGCCGWRKMANFAGENAGCWRLVPLFRFVVDLLNVRKMLSICCRPIQTLVLLRCSTNHNKFK